MKFLKQLLDADARTDSRGHELVKMAVIIRYAWAAGGRMNTTGRRCGGPTVWWPQWCQ